jgi:tRNA pseudouridine55 synthase
MDTDGLYLVDKPVGPTSFGVLRQLRPSLGGKLGHAGTLDPFASGLLLVLSGVATRLAPYLSGLEKTYRAVVQFGQVSTTLDPEGEITPTGSVASRAGLEQAAAGMVGEILQRVPVASAVKVGGVRSHRRMRRGEAVEPAPRMVRIDRLEVLGFDPASQRADIEIACSKGTYVRQIAADLGEVTGAGALCVELRRLTVGPFAVEAAGSPAEVAAHPLGRWWRSPARAVGHLPTRQLAASELEDVRHGRMLRSAGETGATALVRDDRLAAIGVPRDGHLRPVTVLVR